MISKPLGRYQVHHFQHTGKELTVPYKNKGDVLLFKEDGTLQVAYWDELEKINGRDGWQFEEFTPISKKQFDGWQNKEDTRTYKVLKVEGDNLEIAFVDTWGETRVTHYCNRV